MKLQKSPNRWSCLPTAFAIVLGTPVKEIIDAIGHDGSEIFWPGYIEPLRRRGFHIQELINYCFLEYYLVTPFEQKLCFQQRGGSRQHIVDGDIKIFKQAIKRYFGVFVGENQKRVPHALAWDGNQCYDPAGLITNLEDFHIRCFYAIMRDLS
jgi:hypothetical protein